MRASEWLIIIITLALLAAGGLFLDLNRFSEQLKESAQENYTYASFAYIIANIASIVIAPLTVLPLIPVASSIFGPSTSAILSIIGWTLGAMIAFLIARHAGRPILEKFASLDKIRKIEKYIPQDVHFFTILILRMLLPVDALSYALGFFSRIDFWKYSLATLIGVAPFSFIFAYAGGAIPLEKYFSVLSWIILSLILLWLISRIVKKSIYRKFD